MLSCAMRLMHKPWLCCQNRGPKRSVISCWFPYKTVITAPKSQAQFRNPLGRTPKGTCGGLEGNTAPLPTPNCSIIGSICCFPKTSGFFWLPCETIQQGYVQKCTFKSAPSLALCFPPQKIVSFWFPFKTIQENQRPSAPKIATCWTCTTLFSRLRKPRTLTLSVTFWPALESLICRGPGVFQPRGLKSRRSVTTRNTAATKHQGCGKWNPLL